MKTILFWLSGVILALPLMGQTCTDCHPDGEEQLNATAHRSIPCQTCHGENKDHLEDPSSENAPKADSGVCQQCHASFKPFKKHRQRAITCLSCHTLNHGKEKPLTTRHLLLKPDDEACRTCHAEQAAQSQLPHRHRVACYECHDPHKPLKRFDDLCETCHVEKRGPFVFEHLSRRAGRCTFCHEPHGSPNARLLVRHRIDLVCLECHMDLSAHHNLAEPIYQNCIVCHGQIHGSNRDQKLRY